jgi:choline dehydrogenase-like flavoprotein
VAGSLDHRRTAPERGRRLSDARRPGTSEPDCSHRDASAQADRARWSLQGGAGWPCRGDHRGACHPGGHRRLRRHRLTTSAVAVRDRSGRRTARCRSLLWCSDDGLPGPDMQMQFVHVPFLQPGMQAPANSFTLGVATVPKSRGAIRLRNADPAASPLIDPQYLTDVDDRSRLVHGVETARAIVADSAFDGWRGTELYPGAGVSGADELEQFVRRCTGTYCHPVGTCAMGSGDDAVVTPDLRVHGVENLRVIDASVMPHIVSVNTNVPTIMIANRGFREPREPDPAVPRDRAALRRAPRRPPRHLCPGVRRQFSVGCRRVRPRVVRGSAS